jgi:superfamily II DNA/RNA helicase
MQFDQLTPIQKAVITWITEGHDVMGCSQTGSGKTIAFLLPILNKMMSEGPPEEYKYESVGCPVTLVLIPTRELAEQIYKEARKLTYQTGINPVKIYGGVNQDSQARELRYGCDVLIATPGRLLDFLKSGAITLSQVKYLIMDEADRMLDMGFEPQLKAIVYENDMREKSKRQNLMFSATFDTDIRSIARSFMNEYYFIQTNMEKHSNHSIKQMLVHANEGEKIIKLHQILQNVQGSIISNLIININNTSFS